MFQGKRIPHLALACLTLAAAGPAVADNAQRSVTIQYADLDLATSNGASALYGRIAGAARTVCGDDAGRNLNERRAWQTCYTQARDAAIAHVDSPLLNRLTPRRDETRVASLSE
jgi:UrcA family protein